MKTYCRGWFSKSLGNQSVYLGGGGGLVLVKMSGFIQNVLYDLYT